MDAQDLQHATFALFGVFTLSQDLSGRAMQVMPGADPELIAEETLCLTAVLTARTVEAAGGSAPELALSLLATPFLVRDYLVGTAMIESGDAALQARGAEVGERMERKMTFYASHLEPGKVPSEDVLKDKLLLWMGRISSPGLPDGPEARLSKTEAVDRMSTHIRLVTAHLR